MRPDALRNAGILVRPWRAQRVCHVLKPQRSFSSALRSRQSGPSVQAAPPGSSGSLNGASAGSSSAGAASASKPPSSVTTSSTAGANSTKPKGPPSVAGRRNTDLALIISGGLGLSALVLYNIKTRETTTQSASLSTLSPSSKSFTLPIQTSSGLQLRTIQMLAPTKVNELLTANERTYTVTRPNNPLYRYDTNSVASNSTCEDAQSFTIFEHEGVDYILASVFDGHSGYYTSRLMAENLEKYIAREIFEVLKGGYKSLTVSGDSWWNWLWQATKQSPKLPTAAPNVVPSGQDTVVQAKVDDRATLLPHALRTAFNLADRDLIQPPMDYLRSLESASKGSPLQITEEQRQHGLKLLNPALSGSCAISALFDTSSSNLYVALAGDSRAVMGTYNPETQKWTVDVLSEDQTGRNLKEVERMKKEHPKNEEETVIMRGRVLGGLEPTRSFGDGKYKFPLTMQEKLIAAFRPSTSRTAPPSLYKTPPYVTADPVISVTSLASPAKGDDAIAPNELAQSSKDTNYTPIAPAGQYNTSTGIGKRFIVLATDGLYDCLSSEEVVALVAGHLDGLKGEKSKSEVLGRLQKSEAFNQAAPPSPHKPKEDREKGKRFTFEDQNLGTHLVRNALGGAQQEHVTALLSIPPPYSRRYRDDITVNVLLLGDGSTGTRTVSSDEKILPGVTRVYTQPTRAKL